VRTLLLDFFGTLVEYSPSRTEQGYERSHRMVGDFGARLSYADFLDTWIRVSAGFDRRCDVDDTEFSMTEVGTAFLTVLLGRDPEPAEVAAFVAAYVDEWSTGVRYPAGIVDLVRGLAADHRLAVVTNTHHAELVPRHLTAMGIRGYVEALITSVEVGWRKPHPRIYAVALETLGSTAADAVFVGDTFDADYLGPTRVGIDAYLIDPQASHDVPADRRLTSIFDLPARLA
jgi:putative hydrolase of the HAD superfamily